MLDPAPLLVCSSELYSILYTVPVYISIRRLYEKNSFQPENILLNDKMTIKLSDFGFAKELKEGETLTGKYTCAYTNPGCEH